MLSKNRSQRSKQGSTFALAIASGAVIIFLMVLLLTFYTCLICHHRGTDQAECVAITTAQKLDDGDRIGQLNNITSWSREQVFVTRQTDSQAAASDCRLYQEMSAQLMQESRDGAQQVDSEYETVLADIAEDCRGLMNSIGSSAGTSTLKLPWLTASDHRVESLTLGYVKNIDSNVYANADVEELLQADRASNYVDSNSNLFRGNVDARLPGVDSDLRFRFSSIPAPVDKTISPTRTIDGSVFIPTMDIKETGHTTLTEFLPTAVAFTRSTELTSHKLSGRMVTGAAALSHAAALPPQI